MRRNPFPNRSAKLPKNKPDPDSLFSSILKFLSFRPRSWQEVNQYLLSKTDDSAQVQKIIKRLERSGLVNDNEFATWLVASRSRTRPRSIFLLKKELLSFGISPEIVTDVLSSQDDMLQAQKVLSRKLGTWSHLSRLQFRTKTYGLLARRGFSSYGLQLPLPLELGDPRER